MERGGSAGMLIYCRILSTDIILFSKVHMLQTTHACSMFRLSPYVTARPAIPESRINISYKLSSTQTIFISGTTKTVQN
jgi:hypothetical protein